MPKFAFLSYNNGELVKAPRKSVNTLLGLSGNQRGIRSSINNRSFYRFGYRPRSNVKNDKKERRNIHIKSLLEGVKSLINNMPLNGNFKFLNNWECFVDGEMRKGDASSVTYEQFEYYYFCGIKSELLKDGANKDHLKSFIFQVKKLFGE